MPADLQTALQGEVRAERDGTVRAIHGSIISGIAREAGAPGLKIAGVDLKKSVGEKVQKGELLYLIQSSDAQHLELACQQAVENHGYTLEA